MPEFHTSGLRFDAPLFGETPIDTLVAAGTRRNGKRITSPGMAAALAMGAYPKLRIVGEDMTISLDGEKWFIPDAFSPGLRVLVSPTYRGDRLLIESPSGDGPSTLAVPATHPHSPRCTGCTQYTGPNSGSGSTSHEPAQPDESANHAAQRGAPRPSMATESSHTRSSDSGHTDCCGRSIAIHLTVQIQSSSPSSSRDSDS